MLEEIVLQNPWWKEKEISRTKISVIERKVFGQVIENSKSKKITCLIGPRRSGKTTLMYTLMDVLIKSGTKPENIMYVSADNSKIRILLEDDFDSLIRDYIGNIIKEEINSLSQTVYIFVDEIHKVNDWGNKIKYWNDLGLKIKFVVSGSSSSRLLKGSGESLLGRIEFVLVYPLSFSEYVGITRKTGLDFKKISVVHRDLILEKEKILIKLNEYLVKGGYPEVYGFDNEKAFTTLREYKTLTINRDILEIKEIKETRTLGDLLDILTDHISNRINYSEFANILKIKVETVKKFMEYLEEAFLINNSYVYSKSHALSTRKEKKLYFTDVGLRNSLLIKEIDKIETEKIAENVVFSHVMFSRHEPMPKNFYWIDKNKNEVDIVTFIGKKVLPIEVKYSNQISDIKGIKNFMEKFNLEIGIVVTKDVLEKKVIDAKEIFLIPLWMFLLIDIDLQ